MKTIYLIRRTGFDGYAATAYTLTDMGADILLDQEPQVYQDFPTALYSQPIQSKTQQMALYFCEPAQGTDIDPDHTETFLVPFREENIDSAYLVGDIWQTGGNHLGIQKKLLSEFRKTGYPLAHRCQCGHLSQELTECLTCRQKEQDLNTWQNRKRGDGIICPWCGQIQTPAFPETWEAGKKMELHCTSCKRPFHTSKHIHISYETEKPADLFGRE